MAIQIQGKRQVEELFIGDGYSHQLGFRSLTGDLKSLSSGKGRYWMLDRVIDSEGVHQIRADGKVQLEASLEPLIGHTFSNGITGLQLLQAHLELSDMLRDGTLTDISGLSDEDAGLVEVPDAP